MFNNTSQKIKLFAYIYFFGKLSNLGYRDIYQFIQLDYAEEKTIPKF